MNDNKNNLGKHIESFNLLKTILYCAFLVTMAMLLYGYQYGTDDHIEQLPKVFRMLDPEYCRNDFFTESTSGFDPRTYVSLLLTFLTKLAPLSYVCLVLTWLINFSLSLLTFQVAKKMFYGSSTAGVVSALLAMAVSGVTPGGNGTLFMFMFIPSGLAFPIVLWGLWMSINRRPILGACLCAGASAVHPLVGLETGGIALGSAFVVAFLDHGKNKFAFDKDFFKRIAEVCIGGILLFAIAYILWFSKYKTSINTELFMQIIVKFRAPHHYSPKTFGMFRYIAVAIFTFGFIASWFYWRNTLENKNYSYRLLMPFIFVLLAWVCGYVFVEIFPTRIWTIAQTFRMAFIINWLGFIVIGGMAARCIKTRSVNKKFVGLMMILGLPSSEMVLALPGYTGLLYRNLLKNRFPNKYRDLGTWMLLAFALFMIIRSNFFYYYLPTIIMGVVAWILIEQKSKIWQIVIPVALIIFVISVMVVNCFWPIPVLGDEISRRVPIVTLEDLNQPPDDIAKYAKENIENGAVFLTPPNFGRFRLTARRAIVVDFKGFIFQDKPMAEWKKRLDDCYGAPFMKTGFDVLDEMIRNYKMINEDTIFSIADKYGANYVVLYKDTNVNLPLIYQNDKFKIMKIIKP